MADKGKNVPLCLLCYIDTVTSVVSISFNTECPTHTYQTSGGYHVTLTQKLCMNIDLFLNFYTHTVES